MSESGRNAAGGDVLGERVETAVEASRLVAATRRCEAALSSWFRGSRAVGWLLAEPAPEMVVVDLRETYTVGPMLAVSERVLDVGSRAADAAGLTDVGRWLSVRATSEPLRLLGTVLAAVGLLGTASAAALGGLDAAGGWLVILGVGLLATRERRSAERLLETRVGRALRAAFEPPEPPERR